MTKEISNIINAIKHEIDAMCKTNEFGSETLECLNLNWWNDWWKAPYKKGAEQ